MAKQLESYVTRRKRRERMEQLKGALETIGGVAVLLAAGCAVIMWGTIAETLSKGAL
jgi:hypothetical protein